jgi:thymidylate synthase (FAD)
VKAKLISWTRPAADLELLGVTTVKDLITYAARVSNPVNQLNMETSDRLIKYLSEHKHWSPFEMADVTVEIETTRDIARQLLRHRSFTFQEFSQRYSDVSDLGEMFELSEVRMQDLKNRQNSLAGAEEELRIYWEDVQRAVIKTCESVYKNALGRGIAKEVARKVLPEGLTKSRLYMKGSVRSWIHYLEVRGPGSGTQKEHMQLAAEIALAISKIFSLEESK